MEYKDWKNNDWLEKVSEYEEKIKNVVDDTPLSEDKKDHAVKVLLSYWKRIGEELIEMVERNNKLPKTTQYNYGTALQLLGFLTKQCKVDLAVAGLLLVIAGVDKRSVKSAVSIITGRM